MHLMMTHLPIDHVAHGHTNLHACSLDVVEIEVMKDGEANGCQGDAQSEAVGLKDCSCAAGLIILKELNYLPEQHRLNDFDNFLKEKEMESVGVMN